MTYPIFLFEINCHVQLFVENGGREEQCIEREGRSTRGTRYAEERTGRLTGAAGRPGHKDRQLQETTEGE